MSAFYTPFWPRDFVDGMKKQFKKEVEAKEIKYEPIEDENADKPEDEVDVKT